MNGLLIVVSTLLVLVSGVTATAAPQGQIVVAQGVDPTTMDPHWHEETPAYNVLLNVYDTLLFRDRDLKIIPWLAESWKLVNPTTWEFKLRKGVKFHNGDEVDAEAVKFSLDRLRDPELKNRQAGNFRLVNSVDVVDKQTVRVVTSKPFPTLENQLVLRGAIMAPRHFKGKDKTFADRNPVGTGPYKFVRWNKDEQIVLEANEQYWGGAPKVKRLVFRPIPEHAVRVAALQAGEVDRRQHPAPPGAHHREAPEALRVQGAERADDLHPDLYPPVRFGQQAGRRGGRAHEGQAGPAGDHRGREPGRDHQDRPRGPGDSDGHTAHLEALRLRAIDSTRQAGPRSGQEAADRRRLASGIDLTLNSPDGRYLKDKEVAEAVADQLTKAGIRARVRTFEWTTYLNQMVYIHKAAPMYLIGWGNTTWDADGTLYPLWRSGNPLANHYSPDFDGMIDEAQTSVDAKRRHEVYTRAQQLMLDDGAVLPLYQQMDLYGVNKRVNFQALSSEQLVGIWMSLK